MATIKIRVNDIEVECATASDAAAMIRALRDDQTDASIPNGTESPKKQGFSDITTRVTEAFHDRPSWLASALAERLGLNDPKGLGNVAGRLNRDLEDHGIDRDDFYVKERRADKKKVWRRGRRFEEIREQINEKPPPG